MTVLTAHYDGKSLVPDQPVDLPTGVPLRVTVEVPPSAATEKPFWQIAVEIGQSIPDDELAKLPRDGARNLDHYLYGAPRQEP